MNRKEFVELHSSLLDKLKDITARKNADYTGASQDPFFNLKTVETMQIITTEQGFLTRLTDKFTRLISLTKPGVIAQVKDESIEDTLLDMANYCILLACYLRSKREVIREVPSDVVIDNGINKGMIRPTLPIETR